MSVKKYLSLLLFFLLAFYGLPQKVKAQQIQKVSGMVMQKGSANRIAEVLVYNMRTHRSTVTNTFGVFTSEASIGDTLSFTKVGYGQVRTVVTSHDDFVVELQEGITLETVTIQRMSKEAELNDAMRNYSKKGIYNGGKNKIGTYLGSPATALYNLFGSEAKNARRFSSFMDKEKDELQVDRIFSIEKVKAATQLEGEQLASFMQIYRPSYDAAQYWGEYDFRHYVESSLEDFNKRGRPKSEKLPDIEVRTQHK